MFRSSLLLAFIVVIARCEEIAIHSQFAFMPEIADQYSIVRTTIYPLAQGSSQQLPKDYYVKKWQTSSPPTETIKKTLPAPIIKVEQAQYNLIFEGNHQSIPIVTKTPKMVKIEDYFAVTTIYPSAIRPSSQVIQSIVTPQIQIPITAQIKVPPKVNPPPQRIPDSAEQIQERKRVDNSNKQIDWKLINPSSPSNIVIDKDKQIPLTDTRKSGEIGTAQLALEGPQAPLISEQKIQEKSASPESAIKNKPTTLTTDQLSYKGQLQRLKYKNHKWTIVVVILLVVILFLGFLFMRYNRSRSDLWNDFKNKLQNNNSQAVLEQQQADFNPAHTGNELIQQQ